MDKPIEHVTLVQIDLPRIGTAGGRGGIGFGNRQCKEVVEVADRDADTIRAAVIALAVKKGEPESDLEQLEQNRANSWTSNFQGMTFDVRHINPTSFHSTCYATCLIYDALKIDGRYFKLEELRLS